MSDSWLLKLNRARHHLACFEVKAGVWIKTEPYVVVNERDPDPMDDPVTHRFAYNGRFRVQSVEVVPENLSLIIGDCLFNLRSSLDHLALALALRHTPAMTDRQIEGSEFPIFSNRPMSAHEETNKIGCINPGAQAIIRGLQPHLRGKNYRLDPLWQIHELNRIDKHRRLTLCNAGTGQWIGFKRLKDKDWNVQQIPAMDVIPGELKPDAIVLRYTVIPQDLYRGVEMQCALMPEVSFAQGEPRALEPVSPVLGELCDYVRDIVIAGMTKFL